MERAYECLIIGGGPAGGTLALLLARQGISVALVDDGRAHQSGPYETVLAAGRRAFEQLDLVGPDVGVVPDPMRHGAIWGADDVVWRDDEAPGLLVDRAVFDRGLRDRVRQAGGVVYEGVRAEPFGSAYRCGDDVVRARRVAYATGRSRVAELPSPTAVGAASVAITVHAEPAAHDRGRAVVEGVPDGWIWTHAPARGVASAAVFVDRQSLQGRRSRDVVAERLRSASGPAARLTAWRVRHGNDATARCRPVDGDRLVLGDAAACIDPLGSQGIEKAVAAAQHAASVVRSGLEHASWWPRLLRVHHRWECDLQRAHLRVAADYYAREVRFADRPFWLRRAEAMVAPAVPSGALQFRSDLEPARVLSRNGASFCEADGFCDPTTGDAWSRVGRVPLRELRQLFATPRTVHDAVRAAGELPSLFVLSPAEVQAAIEALFTRGWLVPAPPAAEPR